jgi:pimeloyl-ACP methyl ester carboxylesterase
MALILPPPPSGSKDEKLMISATARLEAAWRAHEEQTREMTAVFVHGVPETPEIWEPLRRALPRHDLVAVQLPGFGCARPDGFDATKEAYTDWLIAQLEQQADDGPVDLVGHDWGGILTVRIVSIRPDLVRSWVTDAAGIASPSFEWHDFAKIWQTPGAGEEFFEQQLAAPADERGAVFAALGVPADEAVQMGSHLDDTMAGSILRLYRSAVDIGAEWAPDFVDIEPPGVVLIASDDPFLSDDGARLGAERVGAEVVELDGLGHWWMLQDPVRSAAVLDDFWERLP